MRRWGCRPAAERSWERGEEGTSVPRGMEQWWDPKGPKDERSQGTSRGVMVRGGDKEIPVSPFQSSLEAGQRRCCHLSLPSPSSLSRRDPPFSTTSTATACHGHPAPESHHHLHLLSHGTVLWSCTNSERLKGRTCLI